MAPAALIKAGWDNTFVEATNTPRAKFAYDEWIEALGLPVHRGFFVPDTRTVELGWWEERKCHAAFIQLAGQEGVSEARITEIAPGETLPPYKLAIDEVVYVLAGRGLTSVWSDEGGTRRTFEPLPSTVTRPRSRSQSVTRRPQHSETRRPAP